MFVEVVSSMIMLFLLISFTVLAIKFIPKEKETKEYAPYFYLGISIFRFFSLAIIYIVSTKFFEADYIVLAIFMSFVFIIGVATELFLKKKMT